MRLIQLLGAVSACLLFISPANAVSTTYIYDGSITQYVGGAAFAAFLGAPVQLSYTFDSATADTDASSSHGDYAAVTSITLSIGSNTYTASAGDIEVSNGAADVYLVNQNLSGPNVGGLAPGFFGLQLYDSTGTVFGSDALPALQPDPADFDTNKQIGLNFGGTSGALIAENLTIVPLPSAVWLFGSGLLGLVGLARKKA